MLIQNAMLSYYWSTSSDEPIFFLFGLMFAERVLQHTDNLSKTLQNPNLTAIEGERIAQLTQSTLLLMRTDDNYELFWARLLKLHDEFAVGEPTMPRKRKAPARYEDGAASSEFPSCPKAYYKQIYYETLVTLLYPLFCRGLINQVLEHTVLFRI